MDLWVFMYSNFSQKCRELIHVIQTNNIEIPFTMLCVDDKSLRERIKNNKDYAIKYVPCILFVERASGVVSKYEGEKAFELIYSIIKTEPEPVQQEPVQHPSRQVIKKSPKKNVEKVTMLDDLFGEDEVEEDEVEEDEVEVEEEIEVVQEAPSPIKKKLKASEIVSNITKERKEFESPPRAFDKSGIELSNGPPPPMKSRKTGPPVNVSEIMGNAGN